MIMSMMMCHIFKSEDSFVHHLDYALVEVTEAEVTEVNLCYAYS